MTKFTKDGKALTEEQRIALCVFHGIFGFHYKPECEEANLLDKELADNPEFVKDIFDTVHRLPKLLGDVLIERLFGKSYREISETLGISRDKVKIYEHVAWRKIRHPIYTKPLIHYTKSFKAFEESFDS